MGKGEKPGNAGMLIGVLCVSTDDSGSRNKGIVMSDITVSVTVSHITPFDRVNTHVKLEWPEHFVAISLVDKDGNYYKTFTRVTSQFAQSVKLGDSIQVTGKVKREQTHTDVDYPLFARNEVVLTNCIIGMRKSVNAASMCEAKRQARLAKLGLK
jgi:hypothetical protein